MTFDRDRLIAELTRDEGRRLHAYVDTTGHATAGVGRNLTDVGISDADADRWLAEDMTRAESSLDVSLPWWRNLDDVRQRVMVNMCFNMGINGLMTFRHTLEAIKAGHWLEASGGMLASNWANQVGDRAARLAEAIRTGVMP